ncbi:hypothetical protein G5B31_12935 [Rhodobacter sp. SGA-6-6]|uniref:hypothetical protein n=1 Tax=Rhodobacter sp. SGA-6-6 TaxID=2710882 RepID=UPI0013EB2C2E|nr:hypothetical protein [Rhodobacter sp. SGA-6-6]NGM46440.1 hypothetical protein [Rhodobacter sp. SGA-6-6]
MKKIKLSTSRAIYAMTISMMLCVPGYTQDTSTESSVTDPLDLSRYEEMMNDEGFPTVEEVNVLEVRANEAFKSGDCTTALPIIVEFYTKANTLGNVLKQGLEPYYSAGYKDRDEADLSAEFRELVSVETEFNKLVRKRNAAWVMEAECLIKNGQKDEGLVRLFRALEFISIGIEDRELWKKTRRLLWEQVGYTP